MPKRYMNTATIDARVAMAAERHAEAVRELLPASVRVAIETKAIEARDLDDGRREIFIDGPIDAVFGVSAAAVRDVIGDHRGPLVVRFSSIGGNVMEARAIQSVLLRHPGEVTGTVESVAASAAAYMAISLSKLEMAPGTRLMLHAARAITFGTADELRDEAELLDSVDAEFVETVRAKAGVSRGVAAGWVGRDDRWFTAEEAVAEGLADGITAGRVSASSNVDRIVGAASPPPEAPTPPTGDPPKTPPTGPPPDDSPKRPDIQALRNRVNLLRLNAP